MSISDPRGTFDKQASMRRCLAYRRRILDISQQVSALHAASAFSAAEMVDTIYHGLMRGPDEAAPDNFIMSKGHGCMIQYAILEDLGILSSADLASYCKAGGRLGAHPDYGVRGIEAATGSLGHGAALAVGMAYAENRIRRGPGTVYVVVSDGELQEGSTWEALMMAANLGVTNLVLMVDHNGFQSFGRTSELHPAFYPIREKAEAFGWEVSEVNGHDAGAVYEATISRKHKRPFMLVGNTVKGRGVAFMENVPLWHYRSPNAEEYQIALSGLQEVGQ